MDEYTAWLTFVNTGRVQDYLLYNKYKKEIQNASQGDVSNESPNRWFSTERVIHR